MKINGVLRCRLWKSLVVCQDPGEQIWIVGFPLFWSQLTLRAYHTAYTNLSPEVHLFFEPLLEYQVLVVQSRDRFKQGEYPDEVTECRYSKHISMNGFHVVVHDALSKHAKTLPKGQVSHDIEAVEVE